VYVITADQVDSRSTPDLVETALPMVDGILGRRLILPADRTAGDELQTLTDDPALALDVILALTAAGFARVDVRTTLTPAWTTDWMTDAGKHKLTAYGIAPPSGRSSLGEGPLRVRMAVKCPRCASLDTREVARFGSTSCKALYECRACLEPFDFFKVI
jgi:ring-1,2-phenylacetyl-CoA epoxidase subunit PaaD